MKRKILIALSWGILGFFAVGASATFGYLVAWQDNGQFPAVWPDYAIHAIAIASGKGFIAFFLCSIFRSWLKSLPPNPYKKN